MIAVKGLLQRWPAPFAVQKGHDWLLKREPLCSRLRHGRNRKFSKTLLKRWFLGAVALGMKEAVSKGYSYGSGSCFS